MPDQSSSTLPPPTVPSSSPVPAAHFLSSPHLVTRALYHVLPLPVQHFLRDHGFLRLFDYPAIFGGLVLLLPTQPRLLSHIIHPPPGVYRNLRYGPHPRHTLDLYASHAEGGEGQLSPVVVFTHGGAWGSGNKLMYSLIGSFFDEHCRCVAVVHGYRTYPDAGAEGQVDDLRRTLQWVRENAHRYGGDVRRIFLAGHSSGAHIASYLLTHSSAVSQPAFHAFHSAAPDYPPIAGFVGLSGVYDIASHYQYEKRRGVHEVSPMKPANGGKANFDAHSPVTAGAERTAVSGGPWETRWLLVVGDEDETVPDEQSRRVAELRGGRIWHTGLTVEGKPPKQGGGVAEEEGEEGRVGEDECLCVVYREGDHASTVLPLMLRSSPHSMRTGTEPRIASIRRMRWR